MTVAVDFLETPRRRQRKRDGLPALGALFMIIVCDITQAVHLELTKGEAGQRHRTCLDAVILSPRKVAGQGDC